MKTTPNTKNPILKNENKILGEINLLTDDVLIKKVPEIYAKTLADKFKINLLKLVEDKKQIKTEIVKKDIPKARIPGGSSFDIRGNTVPMEVGKYTIPITGDTGFLTLNFQERNVYEICLQGNNIVVEIISFKVLTDNDENKKEVTEMFKNFYGILENIFFEIKTFIDDYNEKLESKIETYLREKIDSILKKRKNDNDLNPF